MELCPLGSLLKYLQEGQQSNISGVLYVKSDLDQWSREIAKGMEFIADKRVVHADLASRNVLLTSDKTAKISDFGLSRRLYNYTQYVKKQEEPLPWRWMAPESLRRMEFTEKSDVWSFGITLWEIYSFGGMPYAGLSWNIDFSKQLEDGLRLGKPTNCEENKYSLMTLCWESNPELRPTFAEISQELIKHCVIYTTM